MIKFSFQEMQQEMDKKFEKIDQRFIDFEDHMNQRFDKVDQRLDYQDTRLNSIESNMVQKTNFSSLLKILERKKIIDKYEVAHVLYPVNGHIK